LGAPFLGLNAGLVLTSSDFDTGAGLLLHRGAGNAAKTHRLDPHDALCPSGYPTIGQAKAKPGGTAPDRIIVRRGGDQIRVISGFAAQPPIPEPATCSS